MPQLIYKILLGLLVFSISVESIELSFLASVIVIFLCPIKKVSNNILSFLILMFIMAIVGFLSTNWLKYPAYDLFKDIIYFIRPITIVVASYFIVKRIDSLKFVFNVVVLIAFLNAIFHIYTIGINISNIESYTDIRMYGGKQNHLELVALAFILFTPYITIFNKYRSQIIFIISLSFILYFSRTMFIVLFFFFLGYKGYVFLNRRFIKGFLVFSIISVVIGVSISNIETTRDSTGIKKFIYKTKNSFTELFEPFDVKKVKTDRRSLWEHWRAYESQKAIEQINENGIKAWAIGMGYGTKIELDTTVKLENIIYTEVPSIHNGYVYVLFKTGIIGVLFYLCLVFFLLLKFQRFNGTNDALIFDRLIISAGMYLFFNSFVITGFFRAGEFSLFVFSVLLASKEKYFMLNRLKEPIFKY